MQDFIYIRDNITSSLFHKYLFPIDNDNAKHIYALKTDHIVISGIDSQLSTLSRDLGSSPSIIISLLESSIV